MKVAVVDTFSSNFVKAPFKNSLDKVIFQNHLIIFTPVSRGYSFKSRDFIPTSKSVLNLQCKTNVFSMSKESYPACRFHICFC